jgi:hypothetical protein
MKTQAIHPFDLDFCHSVKHMKADQIYIQPYFIPRRQNWGSFLSGKKSAIHFGNDLSKFPKKNKQWLIFVFQRLFIIVEGFGFVSSPYSPGRSFFFRQFRGVDNFQIIRFQIMFGCIKESCDVKSVVHILEKNKLIFYLSIQMLQKLDDWQLFVSDPCKVGVVGCRVRRQSQRAPNSLS